MGRKNLLLLPPFSRIPYIFWPGSFRSRFLSSPEYKGCVILSHFCSPLRFRRRRRRLFRQNNGPSLSLTLPFLFSLFLWIGKPAAAAGMYGKVIHVYIFRVYTYVPVFAPEKYIRERIGGGGALSRKSAVSNLSSFPQSFYPIARCSKSAFSFHPCTAALNGD